MAMGKEREGHWKDCHMSYLCSQEVLMLETLLSFLHTQQHRVALSSLLLLDYPSFSEHLISCSAYEVWSLWILWCVPWLEINEECPKQPAFKKYCLQAKEDVDEVQLLQVS